MSLISAYIGSGLAASRPATPSITTGATAIFFATDTGVLSVWNGAAWAAGAISNLSTFTTADLTEGSNLYFTTERAQDSVGAALTDTSTIDLTYNDAGGAIMADVIDASITYAKMQNVSAASKLIGRGDSGAGSPQEITLGTGLTMTGTTLSASGGGSSPVFRGARVRKSADQTAADYSTKTAIAFNTEDFDTDSIHDTVTNNTRLTVPSGVTYVELWAQLSVLNQSTSATITLTFDKNGSSVVAKRADTQGTSSPAITFTSGPLAVVAGDYFEFSFTNVTDTSVTVVAADTFFGMQILG